MSTVVTIKPSNLPMRCPLLFLTVVALVLDRLAAPEWAWGVAATLGVLLIIGFLLQRTCGTERDVPGFGEIQPAAAPRCKTSQANPICHGCAACNARVGL